MIPSRLAKLRRRMRAERIRAALITNFNNVTYLTGFTGDDSYLFVTQQKSILITDQRYTTQLEEECPALELQVRAPGVAMVDAVAEVVTASRERHLLVESNSLTIGVHASLAESMPQVELVRCVELVEALRIVKDAEEVAAIRRAVQQAERAFQVVRAGLRGDQTERDVAFALEHQIRLFGGKGCSFPAIVAVGSRAALPHARPTSRCIGEAAFVLIDWGACESRYMSDLTRMLVTTKIPAKFEKFYNIVLQAQKAGIAAIRPGIAMEDVDRAARKVIEQAGLGKRFGHGLGHGIGLDIHESPRLTANQKQLLAPGMVVTVEPGVYLPGWGGIRIEDDVLVTEGGHEVLTNLGKELSDTVTTVS